MHTIKVNSLTDAWLDSHRYLLENGNREVMNESINMSVEIEDNFNINPDFDSLFRKTFFFFRRSDKVTYNTRIC